MVSQLRFKDADIQTSSDLGSESKGSYGLSRALDPTLPWEELVDLWVKYPEAVLENPILKLQALAKGEPLHSLLPDLVYASFYIYLSEKGDPEVLQDYIPTERRLRHAGSFRSSSWQYEDLFLYSLYQVSPLFLDKYSRCLAKDPSIEVRQQAAEFLPVHLLSHFLGDSEETVREKLVVNLSTQFSTIASFECHEGSLRRNIGGAAHPFIRSLSKTKEDISDIAIRISHDPCEGIRVKNLCSNYASSQLFESAFVNEDESFFIQFVSSCDWLRKTNHQTSSPVSFELVEQLFSIYPSTLNYMLDEGISSSFLSWKLTQHPDESVSNKAWSLLEFGWGLDEEIVIEDFKKLREQKFKTPWFEKLASKQGLPRFLHKPLWDMGGSVRRALFDNPEPTREKVIAWFKSKNPEELISLVKKGAHTSVISLAAKHDDFRLRALVAGIPGNPAYSFRPKLARDSNPLVRHAVADYYLSTEVWYSGRHYNDTLSELTRDSDPGIRRKICRDYRVRREDVKRLFADPDPEVAIETLRHRHWSYFDESLPLFSLEDDSIREEAANILLDIRPQNLGRATSFFSKLEKVLLADPSSNVRCRLARDPWTSPSICSSLMRDKDTTVHEAVLRGFQRSGECEAREFFIHNYGKNSELLARSRNPWYRACLVRWDRRDCHRHRFLARDPHWFVRAVTAHSPKVHDYLLNELRGDPHTIVSAAAESQFNPFSGNRYRNTK